MNNLHYTQHKSYRVHDWYSIFDSKNETLKSFNSRVYKSYIFSNDWRDRHPTWLKKCKSKCMFTGMPINKKVVTPLSLIRWYLGGKIGKPKKYRIGYNMHHTNYNGRFINNEKYWIDVLPLSPFAHWVVHQVLGGHIKASKQPWGKYPNLLQRAFHCYCRIPDKSCSFILVFSIILSIYLF